MRKLLINGDCYDVMERWATISLCPSFNPRAHAGRDDSEEVGND